MNDFNEKVEKTFMELVSGRRVVGERCICWWSYIVKYSGGTTSEDAGMSNEKTDEKSVRRKPKVSWVKVICPG